MTDPEYVIKHKETREQFERDGMNVGEGRYKVLIHACFARGQLIPTEDCHVIARCDHPEDAEGIACLLAQHVLGQSFGLRDANDYRVAIRDTDLMMDLPQVEDTDIGNAVGRP